MCMNFSECLLTRQQLQLKKHIPVHLLEHLGDARLDSYIDDATNAMVISLRTYIMEQKGGVREARWWQAFKLRWFPSWALKKWPVKYDGIRVEVSALYPNIRVPNEQDYLRVCVLHGDPTTADKRKENNDATRLS